MKRELAKKAQLLGDVDSRTVSRLIGASSDIALVLDGTGHVLDVIVQDAELATLVGLAWKGRAWSDTVTVESREKVEGLLREAAGGLPTRLRHVNHPFVGHDDLPISYAAVQFDAQPAAGRPGFIAFGRDLRATIQLQRRLVEAQQSMERDYWRFREAEARYRTLFQTALEAVVIADGQTLKVLEANPAAEGLLGRAATRLVGTPLLSLFEMGEQDRLQTMLTAARNVGSRDSVRVQLAAGLGGSGLVDLSAVLFRQEQSAFLLVRVLPVVADKGAKRPKGASALPMPSVDPGGALMDAYLRAAPDGLVFTDLQGRVTRANGAFAALAQLSGEDQARGEMLDRWVGRTGVELSVLLGSLRQHGSVGMFATSLRGEVGAVHEVEISAAQLGAVQPPTLAFAVRDIGRRLAGEDRSPSKIARSAGELTELVGRVPMKDIVSETSDLIEQLCIETALQMTNDNRALAAQFLGLSRQSLYVKLRRYGLGDLGGDNSD